MMFNEKDVKQAKDAYQNLHMTEEQVNAMKNRIELAKSENKFNAKKKAQKAVAGGIVAAAAAAFVIMPNTSASVAHAMEQIPILGNLVSVVTFRDYKYDDGKASADMEVPKLETGKDASDKLAKTTDEINAEIQAYSDKIIEEFQSNITDEGYQAESLKSEVVATTDQYFTLKLVYTISSGSGTEMDSYYTIDLATGQRLALADLFKDDADYITPISDNIKSQMRTEMKADANKTYWLDNEDMPEFNFDKIAADQSFYINEKGNIVISFNEGDVAPMYMGVCTFEIPKEAVSDILK